MISYIHRSVTINHLPPIYIYGPMLKHPFTAHSPQLYDAVFNWYQMLGKHSQNFKHGTQQITKGRTYEVNWIRNPKFGYVRT